ncbi:MAG: hypothetical protein ACOY5B_17545 [Spirochaetota bacterium]
MYRKLNAFTLLVLLPALASCQKPPEFVLQGYFFVGAPDEAAAQRENAALVATTAAVIGAVIAEDREKLLSYIHPKEGAIIDAKAFVSYAQVKSALYDKSAILSRVLWDDQYWKETAPGDSVRSYRSVFSRAGEIRLGLFWYSPAECEVRIDFKGRPSMGIMGNLIFRKRGDRWYLMNFF